MKKKYCILGAWLICAYALAQSPAPTIGTVTDGTGIYSGLKKIPACLTGYFYVSNIDDHSNIRMTSVLAFIGASVSDGLNNCKEVLSNANIGYNLSFTSMPSDISSIPNIMTPVGGVEVCFRKNYNELGYLIDGTTTDNMWYLPSRDELITWHIYLTNYNSEFVPINTPDTYWSSTMNGSNSYFEVLLLSGTASYRQPQSTAKVRCFRR